MELGPGDAELFVGAAGGERGERELLAGDAGVGDAEEGHLAMAWACPPRNATWMDAAGGGCVYADGDGEDATADAGDAARGESAGALRGEAYPWGPSSCSSRETVRGLVNRS